MEEMRLVENQEKIFKGKAIQVVEQLKKEIIKEVKSIKLKDENFESYGIDEIREDITAYIDFINLINVIINQLHQHKKVVISEASRNTRYDTGSVVKTAIRNLL